MPTRFGFKIEICSQFDAAIASKQLITRAMPRGYGSIGRPKGQSNPKKHKAGGKREGSGRKKIQLPTQRNKLLFTTTSSTAEDSAAAPAPNNDEVTAFVPNNNEAEVQNENANENNSKDDESDATASF